jgi:TrwC relaxase
LLRSELTARFGVDWHPIVNGQAEITGVPRDLLRAFSKRSAEIDHALTVRVAEVRQREGRDPERVERAAMEREAAKDTRPKKTGNGVSGLVARWREEAEAVGWTAEQLTDAIATAGRARAEQPVARLTVEEVVESLGLKASTWCRADVLRAICDVQRPMPELPARRWLDVLERAADRVVEHCVHLDPPGSSTRRVSDGRSVWIEPTAPGLTSEAVLTEEEAIVAWAIHAQLDDPEPSTTVNVEGLDVFQPRPPQRSPATTRSCWRPVRPGPARPRRCPGLARTSKPMADRCSAWRRLPRPPARCGTRPGSFRTPSPSCSTNSAATNRIAGTDYRRARRWWSTRPG